MTNVKENKMSRVHVNLVNSAIHKAADLTVPSRSMTSTGTIPVGHKNVHWLSMAAASRNHLGGMFQPAFFLGTAGVNSAVNVHQCVCWRSTIGGSNWEGMLGTCAPWGSKFFHFHAVFGKDFEKIISLLGVGAASLGKSWIRH